MVRLLAFFLWFYFFSNLGCVESGVVRRLLLDRWSAGFVVLGFVFSFLVCYLCSGSLVLACVFF